MTLDRCLELFGLPPLPTGATAVRYHYDSGGADPALWLRLEGDSALVEDLLDEWKFPPHPGPERAVRDYTGSFLDWWHPDALEVSAGGRIEVAAPRRHARQLVAGTGPDGRVIVHAFVVGL